MCVSVQQRDVCASVCTTEGRKCIGLCAAERVCVCLCVHVCTAEGRVFVYTAEGRDVYMCVCAYSRGSVGERRL